MRKLWRGACVAALLCGPLAACASPHYPIDDRQAAGPAPLTMGKPRYPITEDAAAVARPPPPAPPAGADADEAPGQAPLAAPVAPVQTQSLPPPSPSARMDGRPRLQYAAMTTEGAPEPASTTAASALPVAGSPPAAPSPTVSPNSTPTAAGTTAAGTTVPPPAAEPALTPQMVVHDQSGPAPATAAAPPIRQAYAATPAGETRPNPPGMAISGDVVAGPGNIFENYEVQRGDHIDALARSFSTTRDVLLDVNHIRSPFVIHPGQIIKVPVAKAYVARAGDTLSGVARRFSVGIDELAQLNHLTDRGQLRAGQQIGLPSSMRDIGPLHVDTQYVDTTLSRSPRGGYTPTSPGRTYAQLPPSQPGLQPLRPQTGYGYQASPPPGATVQAERQMSDSEISTAAKGRFVWPVRGDIMQKFGAQGLGRRNDGVDIRAAQGTPVKAAAPGEVVYAGNQVPGFGNLVLIKHSDGWVTAYAHLDSVDVQMKQQVTQGQSVGTVGASGGAIEPELHFEVRYAPTPADKARPVDPVLVLPIG